MGEAIGDGMDIATDADAIDSALDIATDEADGAVKGSGDGKVKDECLRCADDTALGRGLPNGGTYTGIALLALVAFALHSVGGGIWIGGIFKFSGGDNCMDANIVVVLFFTTFYSSIFM